MTATSSTATSAIEQVLTRVAGDAGALAALRRGVGRSLEESPDSWPYVLMVTGTRRWREPAAHLTLGLFALHHQSKAAGSLSKEGSSLGKAAWALKSSRGVSGASEQGIERRLRAALASETIDALGVHLRGLVTLLRGAEVPLDYPRLYRELCAWLSPDRRQRVCLGWARDYFATALDDQDKEQEP